MRPRVWRWLLPAAGTPLMLSPLPCVSRVLLLSRVKPRVPDPDVPDVWFFCFVLRSEVRATSQHAPSHPTPPPPRNPTPPPVPVAVGVFSESWGGVGGFAGKESPE